MLSTRTDLTYLLLQKQLLQSSLNLNDTINRLTTGIKVNSAKNNAANYSIITDLNTKINSMLQVQNNTEDGISCLQIAEGGLQQIEELLNKIRDLAMQAASGTHSARDLAALETQGNAFVEQIRQIKNSTNYGSINLYETPKKEENVSITTMAAAKLANSVKLSNINETDANNQNNIQRFTPKSVSLSNVADTENSVSAASFYSIAAYSEDSTITSAVDFLGKETKTITIDGVDYTVTNSLTSSQTISYVKNLETGELEFRGSNFTIKGQTDVAHNIIINGSYNYFYGGNLDDTIKVKNSYCTRNYIYGLDGNDNLTGYRSNLYGGNGNDNLNVLGSDGSAYGEAGDDIITISQGYGYGGTGNDTFILNSGNCRAYGQDGDDNFTLNSNSTSIIDGGAGSNTFINNSTATTHTIMNVPGANANTVSFASKETKVLNINGIDYTVTNTTTSTRTLIYKINGDQIEFNGAYLSIKGDENVAHNVKLSSEQTTFYGGNMDDTIHVAVRYTYTFAGGGNDTITISCSEAYINSGSGNDIIKTSGTRYNNYIESEDGDDKITITGSRNTIISSGNNNTLSISGSNNLINGFSGNDNANCISLEANETRVVEINGIEYTIKNNNAFASKILYNINAVTGEISFAGYKANIVGASDKAHNVVLYGYAMNFTGGDEKDRIISYNSCTVKANGGDDYIEILSSGTYYGGDGDDTIIVKSDWATVYGEAGNDILNIESSSTNGIVDGGEDNDTYNINQKTNTRDAGGKNVYYINTDGAVVSGSIDDDTFYISGNNNTILGGGGKDYFVVDGTGNTIDGGTDENYHVNNGSGNDLANSESDPNSGVLLFTTLNETKTFVMNGKSYTIKNNLNGLNQFSYSYNQNTGVITVNSSDFTITSQSNQSNLLNIRGDNNIYNGSNLVDEIKIETGTNNVINGNDGNDILTSNSENNSLLGGSGKDVMNINASSNKTVSGGSGDDVININTDNCTQINSGSGNDTISINGANNNVNSGDGNNTLRVNGDTNTISAANGSNNFTITGNSNSVTGGDGDNILGIQGNDNTVTLENIQGDINIYGNNNSINQNQGSNNVIISGDNNNYEATQGYKNINVIGDLNEITTGDYDDDFIVEGNSNIISSSGGNNEFNIRGDSNNVTGGSGVDEFKVNGDNNILKGGDENDTFMISNGYGNNIDGEGGARNTMINNGDATIFTNVVDITPNPFELKVKVDIGSGEDKYITNSIGFNLFDFTIDFSSQQKALNCLEDIDTLLSSVRDELENIGTTINRLQEVQIAQSCKLENLISSRSTIRDVDIATESSNYIKYSIMQQACIALLSTLQNITPNIVLGLLNV